MTRTYIILDGLADPQAGQALSARWSEAGLHNAVDVAGQSAWLTLSRDEPGHVSHHDEMTEAPIDRAAQIGRRFGLEVRDRVGNKFQPDNDLCALREQVAYEYKSRLATVLVFGLPAVALHYVGPVLAGGAEGADGGRAMVYPWLFELLLASWACVAGGWPILWQGALAVVNRRATGDLLTSTLVVLAIIPSAAGVASLAVTDQPWFGGPADGGGPMFYAGVIAMTLALLQRWLCHRVTARLSGRANWMLAGVGKLFGVWVIATVFVVVIGDWRLGLALGMLLPAAVSLGAINPWSPGWSCVLPIFGFAGLLLVGPGALGLSIRGVEIEIASGFSLIVIAVFALGWRQMATPEEPIQPDETPPDGNPL